MTDRNKRSVDPNLRDDAGRDALLALAETADALVESLRAGVMDRLGPGYDTLAERNPKLVYCSISGYGADGPLAERPATTSTTSAAPACAARPGRGRPAIPGVQIADLAGGSLLGVAGLLAALVYASAPGVATTSTSP